MEIYLNRWSPTDSADEPPFWSLDDFPDDLRRVFKYYQVHNLTLLSEFTNNEYNFSLQNGRTAYYGDNNKWLRHDLVRGGGRILEHVPVFLPTWYKFFSDLKKLNYLSGAYLAKMLPNANIPMHSGAFNSVIRMHFGIRPEGDLGLNVSGIVKRWSTGEWIMFDDTYPHAAWNNSNQERWVLLLRLLHPGMTETERVAFGILEKNHLFWKTHDAVKKHFLHNFCPETL